MLYLAESVECGFDPGAGLAAAAMLAVASATRPLYWPLAICASAIFVFGHRTVRAALAVVALPALLAIGWAARQAVLSGYRLLSVHCRQPAAGELACPRNGHGLGEPGRRGVGALAGAGPGHGPRLVAVAPRLLALQACPRSRRARTADAPRVHRPRARGRSDTRPGPTAAPVADGRGRRSLARDPRSLVLQRSRPPFRVRPDLARPGGPGGVGPPSARPAVRALILRARRSDGGGRRRYRLDRQPHLLPGCSRRP